MAYRSFNPATLTLMKTFKEISDSDLHEKLEKGWNSFLHWERTALNERLLYLNKLSGLLLKRKEDLAALITMEMGKPIQQSRAEIEKCALLCDYYFENAPSLLQEIHYPSNAKKSIVTYNPTGIIYGVMPWNFPFWQVFRFFIPNIVLGNTTLLKHASNVPQCAEAIGKTVSEAGVPEGVFQNLFISYTQSDQVITSPYVQGVTLTGSESAGARVAALAGKHIKKSVLELGGSDPFIVLEDADLDLAVETALIARMQNAGQSCIAAKRFIVHKSVYDLFTEKFIKAVKQIKIGDPMNENTFMGPMATENLVRELEDQLSSSVTMGARILTGGQRVKAGLLYFEPTIIDNVKKGMPAYDQEVFGPLASLFKVHNMDEALTLANDTEFGLGASVWTTDQEKALYMAKCIRTGTVAINGGVRSEPRIPFGGTKKSGYGRELADLGLKEFSNIKTINIF